MLRAHFVAIADVGVVLQSLRGRVVRYFFFFRLNNNAICSFVRVCSFVHSFAGSLLVLLLIIYFCYTINIQIQSRNERLLTKRLCACKQKKLYFTAEPHFFLFVRAFYVYIWRHNWNKYNTCKIDEDAFMWMNNTFCRIVCARARQRNDCALRRDIKSSMKQMKQT